MYQIVIFVGEHTLIKGFTKSLYFQLNGFAEGKVSICRLFWSRGCQGCFLVNLQQHICVGFWFGNTYSAFRLLQSSSRTGEPEACQLKYGEKQKTDFVCVQFTWLGMTSSNLMRRYGGEDSEF